MNSLEAMRASIERQPRDLAAFCKHLRSGNAGPPIEIDWSKIIFTGAGDSYSAALYASELSGGESLAIDPYELYRRPWMAKRRLVVIISASGRTKTNIALARKINRIGTTLGLTSNLDSQLAQACRRNVRLHYTPDATLTSGTSSYTSSLVAIGYLLGKLPLKLEGTIRSLAKARSWSETVTGRLDRISGLYPVGLSEDHALGQYGALKINEVLGLPAYPVYPEEFGHAFIFSVRENDLIIFLNPDRDERTREDLREAKKIGLRTLVLTSKTHHPVMRAIKIAFHFQYFAYTLAQKKRMRECAFIRDQRRLSASSRLIYRPILEPSGGRRSINHQSALHAMRPS